MGGHSELERVTYPLRTVARLTGVSPALLRAWERRHGVVKPQRTPGGTRRYSAADIERIRLLKAAVDGGDRIGEVARLDDDELRQRLDFAAARPAGRRLDEILAALEALDGPEAQQLLSLQLSALGPARFAREVVVPLVGEIGERWSHGKLGIAVEHLATGVLRSMLGAALQPTANSLLGPRIVFATPPGERHELGLLMAALTALGAGANPLFLGAEVPVEDLLGAVKTTAAEALALGLVTVPVDEAARVVGALRAGLPGEVRLWLGGSGAAGLELPGGVERIDSLEDLEQRAALLGFEGAR